MKEFPTYSHEFLCQFMKAAISATIVGVAEGENPFGAGIFSPDGTAISVACNRSVSQHNPLAHAEILAITAACQKLGTNDLRDYLLVATAEPCPMCLCAAATANVKNIVFGACQSVVDRTGYRSLGITARQLNKLLSPTATLYGPFLESDCVALLLNNPKKISRHYR